MAHGSADFDLPDEILSLIPTDPYDQLDLARRITSMAISSRVSTLESEAVRLREKISNKDRVIAELHGRLSHLDCAVQDSDSRLRDALEENAKLAKERDALTTTTKKLSRDLAKLETFKRHLMQSLGDDNLSQQAEAISTGASDQSIAKSSSWEDGTISDTVSATTNTGDPIPGGRPKISSTPYITPRLTPTSTPRGSSTGGTPRGFSTAGSSPRILSGAASPIKSRFEGHTSLPAWYPSSQHPSVPSSPPNGSSMTGHTPRIDGKEFFRQARSRLTYEQFGAFLTNIKELNAHKQSREETLEKAEEIFGSNNKDLFLSFQGLINRNLP